MGPYGPRRLTPSSVKFWRVRAIQAKESGFRTSDRLTSDSERMVTRNFGSAEMKGSSVISDDLTGGGNGGVENTPSEERSKLDRFCKCLNEGILSEEGT